MDNNQERYQHIKFSSVEIPKMKEIPTNKNYFNAGIDNKFFEHLIYYYENSSAHSSFIKTLAYKVVGTGMQGVTPQDSQIIKDYKFNEIFGKATLDYSIFGGFCLELIYNANHTKINQVNYVDYSKVRSGFIDADTDKVSLYFYSPDWFKYSHKEIDMVQSFNPEPGNENIQFYYFKEHTPGLEVYPKPLYYGGLNWIYTDIQLATYYSNLVKNNFVSNTIISVQAPMDTEKQVDFENGIKKDFTSSENAGSILVIYGDGSSEDPIKIIKFNDGADDSKYQWLSQHILDQIIVAHRIPNPIIAGIRVQGSLGGTQEMMDSERIYNVNVIYPARNKILNCFNQIIAYLQTPFQYTVSDNTLFPETKTIQ
jgi:hypothetical protein